MSSTSMTCQPNCDLHRGGRELALRQRDHRVGERLDEIGRRIPVEIAAVGLRAGILRALCELLELLALLQRGDDFLGFVFLVDQDVANLVFLVADLALDGVVFLAQRVFRYRVRLQIVGHVCADQHGLRRQVHLGLQRRALVEPLLLGFADQQLARVEFVANGGAQFGRVGLTLGSPLLEHEVEIGLRVEVLALGRRIALRRCISLGWRRLALASCADAHGRQ